MPRRVFKIPKKEEIGEQLQKKWIQPRVNDGRLKHNINCEVCQQSTSISSEILKCVYCNVVCHGDCFMQLYSNSEVRDPKSWICFFCVSYLDDSRARFEEEHMELENYERKVASQIMIARNWRRYVCRSFYLRVYTVVVKLQIMYHVRHRKRDFMQSLQEKLRPVKLRITKCHNIAVTDRDFGKKRTPGFSPKKDKLTSRKEYHFYFIVTVVDFNHGDINQTWRMNSQTYFTTSLPDEEFDLRCDERIMIGGVSGFHTVVVTLFQQGGGRDYVVGQVHVDLSQNFIWRRGGKFHIDFGVNEFSIKDYGGMELKADNRVAPRGSIEFEIVTYHGMTFECGHCSGTSLEDMVRTLSRLPIYSGYTLEQQLSQRHSKKTGVAVALAGSGSFVFPMKRMWIAIAEGRLYAYSHFGDQLKLSMTLSDFAPVYEFKDDHVVFNLQRHGYPDFSFFPSVIGDTLRWKCAFLSSLRYNQTTDAASAITVAPGLTPFAAAVAAIGNKTFDMKQLVEDLLAMESKLLQQRGYRTQLPAINGVKGGVSLGRRSSMDLTALQQMLQHSAMGKGMGQSTSLPAIGAAHLRQQPQHSPASTKHGHAMHEIDRFLFDDNTGEMQMSPAVRATLQHHHAMHSHTGGAAAGILGAGGDRSAMRRNTDTDNVSLVPLDVRDQLNDRVMESSELDDLVDNSRYQRLGEDFVSTMLATFAKSKINHHNIVGGLLPSPLMQTTTHKGGAKAGHSTPHHHS